MRCHPSPSLRAILAGLLASASWIGTNTFAHADSGNSRDAVVAVFRGCDDTRTCRFAIASGSAVHGELLRIAPDGIRWDEADDATARAVRDRLNALLSSMIHQHKRVELHGLRGAHGNDYAARVTVNGDDVAADEVLQALTGSSATR